MQRTEIFIASPQQFNTPTEVASFLDNKVSYKGFFFMGDSYVLSKDDFGVTEFAKEKDVSNKELLEAF